MRLLVILCFSISLLVSCNRSNDEQPPEITIIQPTSIINASTYDTLHLELKFTDNEQLTEYVVRVVNTSLVPVFPSVVQSLSGREQTVSLNYLLNDPRVASGNCYIEVQLSDGFNTVRKFTQLQFSQVPRALKGLCFVTQPQAFQTNVYRADTSWQLQQLAQYNHDFGDMALSSWWQQVYISGSNNGTLYSEPLSTEVSPWQITVPQGPPAAWRSLCEFDRRLWAAQYGDEKVRAFESNGVSAFNVSCGAGMRPYKIARTGRYAVTAEQDASATLRQVAVYDALNGGALQQYPIAIDVVDIVPNDSVSVFVYGNNAGQGYIYLYDCFANTIWQPYTLPAGTLLISACKVNSNTQLLSFTNGTISTFTMNPIGVIPWHTGSLAQVIRYDPENNFVFAAEGSFINIYNYSGAQLIQTVPAASTVVDFELWHNR
jgi:hypothetical protein